MKSGTVACLIIFLVIGAQTVRAADRNDVDSSRSYFGQARTLYEAGDFAGAAQLLDAGLVFFPSFSDALYLRGVIRLRDQDMTRPAIADLQASMSARTWSSEDPDSASLALADAYVRTGRFKDAIALLLPLRQSLPEEPRVLFLLSRAYQADSADMASAAAAEAMKRFPKYADGYIQASRLSEAGGNSAAARYAVAAGLRELPGSLPLLLRWAALQDNPDVRLRAADDYVSAGGMDPEGAVIALESSPMDPQKYLSIFLSDGGLSHRELVRRASLAVARFTDQASTLRSALDSFTGNRDLDADRDGFWEERMQYKDGAELKWIRDGNQDGVPEFTVDFVSGKPDTLTLPEYDGGSLTLHYEEYPFLDWVTQSKGNTERASNLIPHRLGCPLMNDAGTFPPEGSAAPVFLIPSAQAMEGASYRVQESPAGATGRLGLPHQGGAPASRLSAPGSTASRTIDFSGGKRLFMEEDLTGDGVIDHRVWYENGIPVKGERALSGDGVMASETYRNGKLSAISVDTDGDGRIDYAEQYGAVTTRLWDYNEDGVWDARERPGANGTVIREFSTALSGTFNLRITFRRNVIVSVEKDSKVLPVTPDPRKGIVWIGTPRPSAALTSAVKDGVIALGDRDYLVFRYAETVYVEEIQ